MAAALFTLTLFRRGMIIHVATYFEDAGQRSPVRDVATIVQYDTIAARSSHGAQPTTVARHRALCPAVLERRPVYGQTEHRKGTEMGRRRNRETSDKLYTDHIESR